MGGKGSKQRPVKGPNGRWTFFDRRAPSQPKLKQNNDEEAPPVDENDVPPWLLGRGRSNTQEAPVTPSKEGEPIGWSRGGHGRGFGSYTADVDAPPDPE